MTDIQPMSQDEEHAAVLALIHGISPETDTYKQRFNGPLYSVPDFLWSIMSYPSFPAMKTHWGVLVASGALAAIPYQMETFEDDDEQMPAMHFNALKALAQLFQAPQAPLPVVQAPLPAVQPPSSVPLAAPQGGQGGFWAPLVVTSGVSNVVHVVAQPSVPGDENLPTATAFQVEMVCIDLTLDDD